MASFLAGISNPVKYFSHMMLEPALSRFVEGFTLENFDLQLSGIAKMSKLKLRSDALADLKLPVSVTGGVLENLTVYVPWTIAAASSLLTGSDPDSIQLGTVAITIDTLRIQVSPWERIDSTYNVASEVETAVRRKLAAMEAAWLARLSTRATRFGLSAETGTQDISDRAFAVLARCLKLSVTHVIVTYVDTISDPGHPFTLGFVLDTLQVGPCTDRCCTRDGKGAGGDAHGDSHEGLVPISHAGTAPGSRRPSSTTATDTFQSHHPLSSAGVGARVGADAFNNGTPAGVTHGQAVSLPSLSTFTHKTLRWGGLFVYMASSAQRDVAGTVTGGAAGKSGAPVPAASGPGRPGPPGQGLPPLSRRLSPDFSVVQAQDETRAAEHEEHEEDARPSQADRGPATEQASEGDEREHSVARRLAWTGLDLFRLQFLLKDTNGAMKLSQQTCKGRTISPQDAPVTNMEVHIQGLDVAVAEPHFAHLRALASYSTHLARFSRYKAFPRPSNARAALLSPEQAMQLHLVLAGRQLHAKATASAQAWQKALAQEQERAREGGRTAPQPDTSLPVPLWQLAIDRLPPMPEDPYPSLPAHVRSAVRTRALGWWQYARGCILRDIGRAVGERPTLREAVRRVEEKARYIGAAKGAWAAGLWGPLCVPALRLPGFAVVQVESTLPHSFGAQWVLSVLPERVRAHKVGVAHVRMATEAGRKGIAQEVGQAAVGQAGGTGGFMGIGGGGMMSPHAKQAMSLMSPSQQVPPLRSPDESSALVASPPEWSLASGTMPGEASAALNGITGAGVGAGVPSVESLPVVRALRALEASMSTEDVIAYRTLAETELVGEHALAMQRSRQRAAFALATLTTKSASREGAARLFESLMRAQVSATEGSGGSAPPPDVSLELHRALASYAGLAVSIRVQEDDWTESAIDGGFDPFALLHAPAPHPPERLDAGDGTRGTLRLGEDAELAMLVIAARALDRVRCAPVSHADDAEGAEAAPGQGTLQGQGQLSDAGGVRAGQPARAEPTNSSGSGTKRSILRGLRALWRINTKASARQEATPASVPAGSVATFSPVPIVNTSGDAGVKSAGTGSRPASAVNTPPLSFPSLTSHAFIMRRVLGKDVEEVSPVGMGFGGSKPTGPGQNYPSTSVWSGADLVAVPSPIGLSILLHLHPCARARAAPTWNAGLDSVASDALLSDVASISPLPLELIDTFLPGWQAKGEGEGEASHLRLPSSIRWLMWWATQHLAFEVIAASPATTKLIAEAMAYRAAASDIHSGQGKAGSGASRPSPGWSYGSGSSLGRLRVSGALSASDRRSLFNYVRADSAMESGMGLPASYGLQSAMLHISSLRVTVTTSPPQLPQPHCSVGTTLLCLTVASIGVQICQQVGGVLEAAVQVGALEVTQPSTEHALLVPLPDDGKTLRQAAVVMRARQGQANGTQGGVGVGVGVGTTPKDTLAMPSTILNFKSSAPIPSPLHWDECMAALGAPAMTAALRDDAHCFMLATALASQGHAGRASLELLWVWRNAAAYEAAKDGKRRVELLTELRNHLIESLNRGTLASYGSVGADAAGGQAHPHSHASSMRRQLEGTLPLLDRLFSSSPDAVQSPPPAVLTELRCEAESVLRVRGGAVDMLLAHSWCAWHRCFKYQCRGLRRACGSGGASTVSSPVLECTLVHRVSLSDQSRDMEEMSASREGASAGMVGAGIHGQSRRAGMQGEGHGEGVVTGVGARAPLPLAKEVQSLSRQQASLARKLTRFKSMRRTAGTLLSLVKPAPRMQGYVVEAEGCVGGEDPDEGEEGHVGGGMMLAHAALPRTWMAMPVGSYWRHEAAVEMCLASMDASTGLGVSLEGTRGLPSSPPLPVSLPLTHAGLALLRLPLRPVTCAGKDYPSPLAHAQMRCARLRGWTELAPAMDALRALERGDMNKLAAGASYERMQAKAALAKPGLVMDDSGAGIGASDACAWVLAQCIVVPAMPAGGGITPQLEVRRPVAGDAPWTSGGTSERLCALPLSDSLQSQAEPVGRAATLEKEQLVEHEGRREDSAWTMLRDQGILLPVAWAAVAPPGRQSLLQALRSGQAGPACMVASSETSRAQWLVALNGAAERPPVPAQGMVSLDPSTSTDAPAGGANSAAYTAGTVASHVAILAIRAHATPVSVCVHGVLLATVADFLARTGSQFDRSRQAVEASAADQHALTVALFQEAGIPTGFMPAWHPWRITRFSDEVAAVAARLGQAISAREAAHAAKADHDDVRVLTAASAASTIHSGPDMYGDLTADESGILELVGIDEGDEDDRNEGMAYENDEVVSVASDMSNLLGDSEDDDGEREIAHGSASSPSRRDTAREFHQFPSSPDHASARRIASSAALRLTARELLLMELEDIRPPSLVVNAAFDGFILHVLPVMAISMRIDNDAESETAVQSQGGDECVRMLICPLISGVCPALWLTFRPVHVNSVLPAAAFALAGGGAAYGLHAGAGSLYSVLEMRLTGVSLRVCDATEMGGLSDGPQLTNEPLLSVGPVLAQLGSSRLPNLVKLPSMLVLFAGGAVTMSGSTTHIPVLLTHMACLRMGPSIGSAGGPHGNQQPSVHAVYGEPWQQQGQRNKEAVLPRTVALIAWAGAAISLSAAGAGVRARIGLVTARIQGDSESHPRHPSRLFDKRRHPTPVVGLRPTNPAPVLPIPTGRAAPFASASAHPVRFVGGEGVGVEAGQRWQYVSMAADCSLFTLSVCGVEDAAFLQEDVEVLHLALKAPTVCGTTSMGSSSVLHMSHATSAGLALPHTQSSLPPSTDMQASASPATNVYIDSASSVDVCVVTARVHAVPAVQCIGRMEAEARTFLQAARTAVSLRGAGGDPSSLESAPGRDGPNASRGRATVQTGPKREVGVGWGSVHPSLAYLPLSFPLHRGTAATMLGGQGQAFPTEGSVPDPANPSPTRQSTIEAEMEAAENAFRRTHVTGLQAAERSARPLNSLAEHLLPFLDGIVVPHAHAFARAHVHAATRMAVTIQDAVIDVDALVPAAEAPRQQQPVSVAVGGGAGVAARQQHVRQRLLSLHLHCARAVLYPSAALTAGVDTGAGVKTFSDVGPTRQYAVTQASVERVSIIGLADCPSPTAPSQGRGLGKTSSLRGAGKQDEDEDENGWWSRVEGGVLCMSARSMVYSASKHLPGDGAAVTPPPTGSNGSGSARASKCSAGDATPSHAPAGSPFPSPLDAMTLVLGSFAVLAEPDVSPLPAGVRARFYRCDTQGVRSAPWVWRPGASSHAHLVSTLVSATALRTTAGIPVAMDPPSSSPSSSCSSLFAAGPRDVFQSMRHILAGSGTGKASKSRVLPISLQHFVPYADSFGAVARTLPASGGATSFVHATLGGLSVSADPLAVGTVLRWADRALAVYKAASSPGPGVRAPMHVPALTWSTIGVTVPQAVIVLPALCNGVVSEATAGADVARTPALLHDVSQGSSTLSPPATCGGIIAPHTEILMGNLYIQHDACEHELPPPSSAGRAGVSSGMTQTAAVAHVQSSHVSVYDVAPTSPASLLQGLGAEALYTLHTVASSVLGVGPGGNAVGPGAGAGSDPFLDFSVIERVQSLHARAREQIPEGDEASAFALQKDRVASVAELKALLLGPRRAAAAAAEEEGQGASYARSAARRKQRRAGAGAVDVGAWEDGPPVHGPQTFVNGSLGATIDDTPPSPLFGPGAWSFLAVPLRDESRPWRVILMPTLNTVPGLAVTGTRGVHGTGGGGAIRQQGTRSVAGRSVAGRSVAGRSVAGRSVAGRSVAGRSVAFGWVARRPSHCQSGGVPSGFGLAGSHSVVGRHTSVLPPPAVRADAEECDEDEAVHDSVGPAPHFFLHAASARAILHTPWLSRMLARAFVGETGVAGEDGEKGSTDDAPYPAPPSRHAKAGSVHRSGAAGSVHLSLPRTDRSRRGGGTMPLGRDGARRAVGLSASLPLEAQARVLPHTPGEEEEEEDDVEEDKEEGDGFDERDEVALAPSLPLASSSIPVAKRGSTSKEEEEEEEGPEAQRWAREAAMMKALVGMGLGDDASRPARDTPQPMLLISFTFPFKRGWETRAGAGAYDTSSKLVEREEAADAARRTNFARFVSRVEAADREGQPPPLPSALPIDAAGSSLSHVWLRGASLVYLKRWTDEIVKAVIPASRSPLEQEPPWLSSFLPRPGSFSYSVTDVLDMRVVMPPTSGNAEKAVTVCLTTVTVRNELLHISVPVTEMLSTEQSYVRRGADVEVSGAGVGPGAGRRIRSGSGSVTGSVESTGVGRERLDASHAHVLVPIERTHIEARGVDAALADGHAHILLLHGRPAEVPFGATLGLPCPSLGVAHTRAQQQPPDSAAAAAPTSVNTSLAALSALVDACEFEELAAGRAAVASNGRQAGGALLSLPVLLEPLPIFHGAAVVVALDAPIGAAFKLACPIQSTADLSLQGGFDVSGSMAQILALQEVQKANAAEPALLVRLPPEVSAEPVFSLHVSAPMLRVRTSEEAGRAGRASTELRCRAPMYMHPVEGGEGADGEGSSLVVRSGWSGTGAGVGPPLPAPTPPTPPPTVGEVALKTEAYAVLRPLLVGGGARMGGSTGKGTGKDSGPGAASVLSRAARALLLLSTPPTPTPDPNLMWRQNVLALLSTAISAASSALTSRATEAESSVSSLTARDADFVRALSDAHARAQLAEERVGDLERMVRRERLQAQQAREALQAAHALARATAAGSTSVRHGGGLHAPMPKSEDGEGSKGSTGRTDPPYAPAMAMGTYTAVIITVLGCGLLLLLLLQWLQVGYTGLGIIV